jgi:hypothetical protein
MSERVLPPFVLSSCTARHGAGPRSQGKKVSKRPRKPDGRAPGSVREPGGLRLRLAQLPTRPLKMEMAVWPESERPRGGQVVAPPCFFFFGLQAQAPRVDPRTALPLAGKKRGGTCSRHAERTRNCQLRKTRPRAYP